MYGYVWLCMYGYECMAVCVLLCMNGYVWLCMHVNIIHQMSEHLSEWFPSFIDICSCTSCFGPNGKTCDVIAG